MTGTIAAPTSAAQDYRQVPGPAMVAYLQVSGMGCPRCAERVHKGLQQLYGVSLAEVDLNEGLAAVLYDPRQVTPPDLVEAVAAAGNDGHRYYQGENLAQLPTDVAHVGWT